MVFRGKPSGACLPCRQRRIKCDRRTPGCKSCCRAGIQCHGYRAVPQTVFYDETTIVISKVRGFAHRNATLLQSLISEPDGEKYSPEPIMTRSPSFHFALSPNLDDFALNYYRAYHFQSPHLHRGYLDSDHDILTACMRAHGLATCAVVECRSDMALEARRYYQHAIQKVNAGLLLDRSAAGDDLLLAVMVLSTFEVISESWQVSFDRWSSHVRGCTAILEARGAKQMQTSQGRLLFMQAIACLMSLCLLTSMRLPPVVQELTDEGAAFIADAEDVAQGNIERRAVAHGQDCVEDYEQGIWAMHLALSMLTNVHSDVANDRIDDVGATCVQLLRQEEQFCAAFKLPERELMDSATVDSLTYDDALNEYLSVAARVSMRTCRTLLHVMILDLIKSASRLDWAEQVHASTDTLDRMKAQILALTPYQIMLGHRLGRLADINVPQGFPDLRQLLSSPTGVSTAIFEAAKQILTKSSVATGTIFNSSDIPILRISHGYNIISSLLLVGCLASPASQEREATCKLLRLVRDLFSVRQAGIFAERLERDTAG